MFFKFEQNNSGGSFDIDDAAGLGHRMWIEAPDVEGANERAEALGIYFDGCENGRDCPCCGDRWYPASVHRSAAAPEINLAYDFNWHDTIYVHRLDGSIERWQLSDDKSKAVQIVDGMLARKSISSGA